MAEQAQENGAASEPQRSRFLQRSASFFSRSSAESSPDSASRLSVSGISAWARSLKPASKDSAGGQAKNDNAFAGFGRRSGKIPVVDDEGAASPPPVQQDGALGNIAKGLLDSSRNAVKAVQTKARHLVSQNKRRYQEGGFDLDMTYITDTIIAMGFPAGDISSGLFGYMEGFYRNHMEEVIKFFETHHKGKYKVYNLCSERLYDVSLFEGKVASFPFDDHNCPPLQLVMAFCRSAYDWLREDLENVVVVHCKAGMARTGLMISSLLLYLKFFPTAEECIVNYNERRCFDSKGLVLPSQLRYVKYFERVLKDYNGITPTGRKCILRGIRLHRCPPWIRPAITISDHNGVLFSTKKHPRTHNLLPEDFWFSAPRKGVMVFALPGERCVADLDGDFKIHFHDRHGDFYCWLNTNMMESRQMLGLSELDGFDKRKLPSPGFQVEVVILDGSAATATAATGARSETAAGAAAAATTAPSPSPPAADPRIPAADDTSSQPAGGQDDVFSDSESESGGSGRGRQRERKEADVQAAEALKKLRVTDSKKPKEQEKVEESGKAAKEEVAGDDYVHVGEATTTVAAAAAAAHPAKKAEEDSNDFRAIAADSSVFTFGDEEDYESDG